MKTSRCFGLLVLFFAVAVSGDRKVEPVELEKPFGSPPSFPSVSRAMGGAGQRLSGSDQLPDTLDGQTFLFTVASTVDPDNPNAGFSYLMTFGKESYKYQIIGSNRIITGTYTYVRHQEKLATQLGVITANELYENKESVYQMVLLPKDQTTGLYLYKQEYGAVKPDVRLNAASYTRIIL